MKLAFIAHRANHLKHYGPLIDAALNRGWEVACLVDVAHSKGSKAYLNLSTGDIQILWGAAVSTLEFSSRGECRRQLEAAEADAAISLHPRSHYFDGPLKGMTFITLQHSVDSFVEVGPEELASSDHLCFFSPFWWDYMLTYYARVGTPVSPQLQDRLAEKIAFTGFAQMDVLARIDPSEVRARYGIVEKKPIVLLLPLDLEGWPGEWPHLVAAERRLDMLRSLGRGARGEGLNFLFKYWRWALAGWNDTALTTAIKRFAERNGAFLLVKGRQKHPLRAATQGVADLALYDDAHYPATVLEAMAIADLSIVFYSTAAQEAAYAGVPSLCIDRVNRDTVKHRLWRTEKPGGPYNFEGVVEWMSIPQAIRRLPHLDLEDFPMDAGARQRYLETYLGPPDCKASQRILDLVAPAGQSKRQPGRVEKA